MKTLHLMCAVSLIFAGVTPGVALAQTQDTPPGQGVVDAVQKKKAEELDKETSRIVQEAVDGIKLTRAAYDLLDQDNTAEAKDRIVEALGKIDAAIQANPDTALLPVEADVQVLMGVNDLRTAMQHKAAAAEVLAMNNVQAARALLAPMIDEVDIQVLSVPVSDYKVKLNAALGQLQNNKKWEARQSLRDALSLFILDTDVIPVPTIHAEALIDEAIVAAKTDNDQATQLLQQANDALALSTVLGYSTDADNTLKAEIHSEHKKLSQFKHKQMKEEMLTKINNLETKIKDSTSDWTQTMHDQITKIRDKLASAT